MRMAVTTKKNRKHFLRPFAYSYARLRFLRRINTVVNERMRPPFHKVIINNVASGKQRLGVKKHTGQKVSEKK